MTSSFLEKLPLEIRHEVYRYIVGRHTKHDHAMNSKAVDQNPGIVFGPDHSYQFHESILCVNRQTRREALDILQSETVLVSLQLPKPAALSRQDMIKDIRRCGVDYIYRGELDSFNPPFSMNIEMVQCSEPSDETMYFVFTADDLPAACVYLQRKIWESNDSSGNAYIRVRTYPCVIETGCLPLDDAPPKLEIIRSKCLEPLMQIRCANQVDIDGPTSDGTAALIAAMTDRRLRPREILDLVASHLDRGDQYVLRGAFRRAITEYKAGCHTIEMHVRWGVELNSKLVGGQFHGLVAGWALESVKARLHAKIASTYLQLGQPRMARIYVERICLSLAVEDDKGYLVKFFLDVPEDEDNKAYAELLFVAARISIAAGNEGNAQGELREARRHDPDREDIRRLLEQCETRQEDRRQLRESRRQKTRDGQVRSSRRRYEADIQCASYRIAKADALVRVNDLLEARELYEATYWKLEYYVCDERGKTLQADSLTKLTNLSMELQDDEAVGRWVAVILALHEPPDLWDPYDDYDDHFLPMSELYWAVEAFYTAYYSKAVILQRQGKITAAIQNFEAAMTCDGGCHATYYQLEKLKRQKADEDTKR